MTTPSFAVLGSVIRQRREALRLTQGSIAAAVGVDQTTVSSWENGQARPRPANLEALAAELHCSVDELRELAGYPLQQPSTSVRDVDAVVTYYRAHHEALKRQPQQRLLLAIMRALVESDLEIGTSMAEPST